VNFTSRTCRSDRTRLRHTCLVLALTCAAGCSPDKGEAPTGTSQPPVPSEPDAQRNIILISVDTLRADHLGVYGYELPTSPAIDEFAGQAVIFEAGYATSPWTKPSHASIFSGLYPNRHGASTFRRAMADVDHFAEDLTRHGYQTAAVVSNAWLTHDGLERGFEDFVWEKNFHGVRAPTPVIPKTIDWLEQRDKSRPFFLFTHFMDVHADYESLASFENQFVEPYDGPAEGTSSFLVRWELGLEQLDQEGIEHLVRLYDAGIRQMDTEFGKLFNYLRENGLLENSLVIFVSDHGEEFFDHDGVHHGHTQFEEMVRVPFLMSGPGLPIGRVATPVSLVDVYPTVARFAGFSTPDGLDGTDLIELLQTEENERAERCIFFDASCSYPNRRGKPLRRGYAKGVRRGRYKLLHDTSSLETLLFDLEQDPLERVNIAREESKIADELLAILQKYLEIRVESVDSGEKSAEIMEELKAMGYAGVDDE